MAAAWAILRDNLLIACIPWDRKVFSQLWWVHREVEFLVEGLKFRQQQRFWPHLRENHYTDDGADHHHIFWEPIWKILDLFRLEFSHISCLLGFSREFSRRPCWGCLNGPLCQALRQRNSHWYENNKDLCHKRKKNITWEEGGTIWKECVWLLALVMM